MSRFVLTAAIQLQAPTNTGAVVNQIRSQLKGANINIQAKVPTQKLAQTNKQIQQITASTNMAQRSMGSLGATIGAAARRFAAITVATGTFLALARGIGEGFKAALAFEVEMLKLSQVTGKTVGDLKSLADQVTNVSITLGVASSEILGAARVLAQAGFSAQQTTGALKILAQTDLAATFESIAQTTEGAVAILRQFRKEVASAGGEVAYLQQALGAINAVSKQFAVESSDLIAVVRRTGGVFEAAGGKLNELIALFTSVRGTTRETAETIATGFRTIFTRIQRTETIDQLRELGIVLQDSTGKFVGPLEAIRRLSIGLGALDPRDFRFNEIVEQLGGFRQIGKVIPLIKQYQMSIESLAVAQGGGASLAKDAEIAQQSLANQFAQVREKFLAMIRTFADSSTFRSMAKMAIKLAEAFIKVAEAIEPILPMLTALMAVKVGTMAMPAMGRMAGMGAASGGRVRGFASGGWVPGRGSRDTVPAMLQPGEFVIKKSSAKALGPETLGRMNKYTTGGGVRRVLGTPGDKIKSGTTYTGKGGTDVAPNTYRLIDQLDATALKALEGDPRLYGGAFLRPRGVTSDVGGTLGAEGLSQIQKQIEADPKAMAVRQLLASKSGGAGGNQLRTKFEDEMKRIESAATREDFKLKVGSLRPDQAELLENELLSGVIDGVHGASQKVFGENLKIHGDQPVASILKQANIDNVIGNMFEMVLTNAGKFEPWAEDSLRAHSNADFDYPAGLGAGGSGRLATMLGLPPNIPSDAKSTFNQGNVASFTKKIQNFEGKKAVQEIHAMVDPIIADILASANAELGNAGSERMALFPGAAGSGVGFAKRTTAGLMGRAAGGRVDSVPALLTPGEFVINKSSAGKIGYSNLNSMNQTGVAKFAKGGVVGADGWSRYIGGGQVAAAMSTQGGGPLGPGMAAVEKAAFALTKSIGDVMVQLGSMGKDAAATGKALLDLATMANTTKGFFKTIETNLTTMARLFGGMEGMFEPLVTSIGNVSKAITASGEGISAIDDIIREQLVAAGAAFTEGLVNAAAGISSLDDMMKSMLGTATEGFGTALTAAASEMKSIDDILKTQLEAGVAPLKAAMEQVAGEMKSVDDTIKVQLEAAVKPLAGAFQTAANELKGTIETVRTSLNTIVDFPGAVEGLQAAMTTAAPALQNLVGPAEQLLTPMNTMKQALLAFEGAVLALTGAAGSDVPLVAAFGEKINQLGVSLNILKGQVDNASKETVETAAKEEQVQAASTGLINAFESATARGTAMFSGAGPGGAAAGGPSLGTGGTGVATAGAGNVGMLGMGGTMGAQAQASFMGGGQASMQAFSVANQEAAMVMQKWTADAMLGDQALKGMTITTDQTLAAMVMYEEALAQGMGSNEALSQAKMGLTEMLMKDVAAAADNPQVDEQLDQAKTTLTMRLKGMAAGALKGTGGLANMATGGVAGKMGNRMMGGGYVSTKAGAPMGGGGGQMMMAAMMVPMMAQMSGLEGPMTDAISQFAMMAGILPMVISSLTEMAFGAMESAWASLTSAKSDTTEAVASSTASKAAIGLSLLAIAVMAMIAVINYFKGKAKEAGDAASEMVGDIKSGKAEGGAAGVSAVRAKRLEAVAYEGKARSAKTNMGGAIAIGAGLGLILGGPIGAGIGALIGAAVGYFGNELGFFSTAMSDAELAAISLSEAQVWAATALQQYAGAQKQAQQLQLKGTALLKHQNKAADAFAIQSKKAETAMAEFEALEASGFEGLDDESMEKSIEEAEKGMRELSKAAFQVANDQRKAIKSMGDELIKGGKTAAEVLSDPNIVAGLKKMGDAALKGFRADLKGSGFGMSQAMALHGGGATDFTAIGKDDPRRAKILAEAEKQREAEAQRLKNETMAAERKRIAEQAKAAEEARRVAQVELNAKVFLAAQARRSAEALAIFEGALTVVGIGLENMSANLAAATGKFEFVDRSKQTADLMKSENPRLRTAGFQRAGAAIGPAGNKMAAAISRSEHKLDQFEKVLGQKSTFEEFKGGVGGEPVKKFDDLKDYMKKFGIDISKAAPAIQAKITEMLKDGLDPDEIGEIIEMFKGPIEAQKENLMKMVEAQGMFLAKYNEVTTQLIEAKKAEIEGTVKLLDIQEKGADRLAKAQGRSRSVIEKEAARNESRSAKLKGTGIVAGDSAGAGARMTQWKAEMDANNKLLAQKTLSAQAEMNLIKRQKELEQGINQARESLEDLADQSERAADIMGEIDKERSKREAVSGTVKEFTFGGDDQRKQLNTNLMALQRVLATGTLNSIPGELRSAVGSLLDKFKDVDVTGTGMTGAQVSQQLQVQQMNQMIRMQTGGARGITPAEIKKIFMSTTKEDKLINDLKELNKEEQKAQMLLNQQLRNNTAQTDKMVTALGKQVQSIDKLIAQMQKGGRAPGAATGGLVGAARVIHLAEGGGDFWAPRGTDTVPAMLTPGEFVIRKSAVDRVGVGTLNRINKGGSPISRSRGGPAYLAGGGLALATKEWIGDDDATGAHLAASAQAFLANAGMDNTVKLFSYLMGDRGRWDNPKKQRWTQEFNKYLNPGKMKEAIPWLAGMSKALVPLHSGTIYWGESAKMAPIQNLDLDDKEWIKTSGWTQSNNPVVKAMTNSLVNNGPGQVVLNSGMFGTPMRLTDQRGQRGVATGIRTQGSGNADFWSDSYADMTAIANATMNEFPAKPYTTTTLSKFYSLLGSRLDDGDPNKAKLEKMATGIKAWGSNNRKGTRFKLSRGAIAGGSNGDTTGLANKRKQPTSKLQPVFNRAFNSIGQGPVLGSKEAVMISMFAPQAMVHATAIKTAMKRWKTRSVGHSFKEMFERGAFKKWGNSAKTAGRLGLRWPPAAIFQALGGPVGFARGGPVVNPAFWTNRQGKPIEGGGGVEDLAAGHPLIDEWVQNNAGGNEVLFGDTSIASRADWLSQNPQGLGIWQQVSDLHTPMTSVSNQNWMPAGRSRAGELFVSNLGGRDDAIYAMGVARGAEAQDVKLGENFKGNIPRFGVGGPFKFTSAPAPNINARFNRNGEAMGAANIPLASIMGAAAPLWQRYAQNYMAKPAGGGQDVPMMLPGASGSVGRAADGSFTFSANENIAHANQLVAMIRGGRWNPFAFPNLWENKRVMAGWAAGLPPAVMEMADKRWPADPGLGARNLDGSQYAVSYFAKGGGPKGTDTVPAMLTPGEFVMSKKAVQSHGMAAMQSLNKGKTPQHLAKGGPIYRQYGGDGGGGSWMDGFAMAIPALDNAAASMELVATAMDNFVDSMSAGWQMWHNVTLGGAITIHGFDSENVRLAIEESIGAYIGDFVQKAIEGVVGSLWKKLG